MVKHSGSMQVWSSSAEVPSCFSRRVSEVHRSWDPGGVTMPSFKLQSSNIRMLMLISQGSQAMNGFVDQEYYLDFDHDGVVDDHSISTSLDGVSIDHDYYYLVEVDQDPAGSGYFLGISFDRVCIGNNYCFYLVEVSPRFGSHRDFDQVQEHRAQWDPGGHRLGVKPSFKEGGMLGSSPNMYSGLSLDPHMGLARAGPSLLQVSWSRHQGKDPRRIRLGGGGFFSWLSFFYLWLLSILSRCTPKPILSVSE